MKNTKLRSSKYLNNLNRQDHRGIKSRTGPMLGFKNFGIVRPRPSPASNCSARIVKDNFAWGVSVTRTKLHLQSGMRYSPLVFTPPRPCCGSRHIFAPEPERAHSTSVKPQTDKSDLHSKPDIPFIRCPAGRRGRNVVS